MLYLICMKRISKYLKWTGGIIALGPILIAFVGIGLSLIFMCDGGGGDPGVCVIGGAAMGNFVWTLVMLHWLSLITILPGFVIWLFGLMLARLAKPGGIEFRLF